jgi:hypothetical protein
MKKTFIATALTLSALSFAYAQDASTTASMPAALPPVPSTGDVRIDEQVRALHKEMEAKIKTLRDEYQKKLKAIIGERKLLIASTTKQMRVEIKEERKDDRKEVRTEVREVRKEIREEVRGTSTGSMPQGSPWNIFKKFFGPRATSTQQ